MKSFSLKSEVRSHDAKTAANARPNGHISIGWRVLQYWSKRGLHIQRGEETPFRGICQLDCAAKIALSDSGGVID
jgi:hypothetical protein